MHIRTFNILIGDVAAEKELNSFLSSNKIVDVQQAFYQQPGGAYFAFCVRYIPGAPAAPQPGTNPKKDYRNELSPEHFTIFSRLREIRKQLAAKYAVSAYLVFTDAELASIAQLPDMNPSKLLTIQGIGDKKVEKYGHELLSIYYSNYPAIPPSLSPSSSGSAPSSPILMLDAPQPELPSDIPF